MVQWLLGMQKMDQVVVVASLEPEPMVVVVAMLGLDQVPVDVGEPALGARSYWEDVVVLLADAAGNRDCDSSPGDCVDRDYFFLVVVAGSGVASFVDCYLDSLVECGLCVDIDGSEEDVAVFVGSDGSRIGTASVADMGPAKQLDLGNAPHDALWLVEKRGAS